MSSVAVVFGGPSPEHDISILTGLQAARALSQDGTSVLCLYWTKTGVWLRVPLDSEASAFLDPTPAGAVELELTVPGGFSERKRMRNAPLEIDVVLNSCHGGPGEDGTLTGLLLMAGLKVTGPNPETCALLMDKLATSAVAEAAEIPTIPTHLLTEGSEYIDLPRPWVVKPRFGGSSIGVEAGVEDIETAHALARTGAARAGTIVQPFFDGWVDLNISIRRFPEWQLSEIERPIRKDSRVYTYDEKYLSGGQGLESVDRELPAQIPDAIRTRIEDYTLQLGHLCGLTGAARVDYLWDGDDSVVLCEINAIPGAWGAYLWQAIGVSRTRLLQDLVAEARTAGWRPQWSSSSDGSALRVAGSIARKLS